MPVVTIAKKLKFFSGKKTVATGGLQRHLEVCHNLSKEDIVNTFGSEDSCKTPTLVNSQINNIFQNSDRPRYKNKADKQRHILRNTSEWVARDLVPLSLVESAAFRKMIYTHNPDAKEFTNKNVKYELIVIEKEIRDYIVKLITINKSWISLTLDHWTSISKQKYIGK